MSNTEQQITTLLLRTLKKYPEFINDPVVTEFIDSQCQQTSQTHQRPTPDEDDGLTPAEKEKMLKLLR